MTKSHMPEFKAPDFTNLNNAFKKNAEAFTTAAQMATESMNVLLRRYSEIAQNQITESFDAMKDITSASNPEQAQARHKEYVKSALENSVSNTKELIDLASKSSREMLEAVGSRVSDTINESLNAVKK